VSPPGSVELRWTWLSLRLSPRRIIQATGLRAPGRQMLACRLRHRSDGLRIKALHLLLSLGFTETLSCAESDTRCTDADSY
jgi:hypothetical protein